MIHVQGREVVGLGKLMPCSIGMGWSRMSHCCGTAEVRLLVKVCRDVIDIFLRYTVDTPNSMNHTMAFTSGPKPPMAYVLSYNDSARPCRLVLGCQYRTLVDTCLDRIPSSSFRHPSMFLNAASPSARSGGDVPHSRFN